MQTNARCSKIPVNVQNGSCALHSDLTGTIHAKAKRPSSRELPLKREALTDLELAANGAGLSSGWFRRRVGSASCIEATTCRQRAAASQEQEELFVVELVEPTDLVGIRIQLEGGQNPAVGRRSKPSRKGFCREHSNRSYTRLSITFRTAPYLQAWCYDYANITSGPFP